MTHKASLVLEADAETVFEDIRKEAPPPRARDRGLTAEHLTRFFDPSLWKGMGMGMNFNEVRCVLLFNLMLPVTAVTEEEAFPGTDYPPFGYAT